MSNRLINIVGVGGTLMGDDGAGPAVVGALEKSGVPEWVRLYDAGLAVSDVLGGLSPSDSLIIVDAMKAGGAPGSIYRLRLDETNLSAGSLTGHLSLHDISVAPALRMEALSGRRFEDVVVFGIEPESVDWGIGLSDAVAAAVGPLVEEILKLVQNEHALGETVSAGMGERRA